MRTHPCSNCGEPRDNDTDGYCRKCRAAKMRQYRSEGRMNYSPEQIKRIAARKKAGTYLKRGLIEKANCEKCDSEKSQMHHEDYDKPLEVRWLCRPCHLAEHPTGKES